MEKTYTKPATREERLSDAAQYTLDNLDAALAEKLITCPNWFQVQLNESRELLRAALAVAE
ncbi:MAG TPA: hypothetical protein VFH95_01745 [Candidatus Kapabacteria bacterium]|nr:hypothetical protein [Candidatus Kapabacteria bacterium]